MDNRPLTQRLIDRLPGPFWMWVLAWLAVVPIRPLVNGLVLRQFGYEAEAADLLARVLPTHGILGLIVAITLVGSSLLWRRAQSAASAIGRVDPSPQAADETFRGLRSTTGPVVITLLLALISEYSNLERFPVLLAAVDAPMLFVVALPIAGFVWSYASVLVSVHRLGQHALALEPFPGDRSLGLRPIGSLVFTGFAILSAAVVLYLVFLGHYFTDLLMGSGVFVFGFIVFLLSMWRLHSQMVSAKRAYVDRAQALYAEAYQPLRREPTLAALEKQAGLLGAAEGLERRAESILEWPIDERTVARLAVITTGVITGLALRAVVGLIPF